MEDRRNLQARLAASLADSQRLRDEVHQLKEILARHAIALSDANKEQPERKRWLPAPDEIAQVETITDNQAKITLFRSLFRGREDAYAERWRTKRWDVGLSACGQEELAGRACESA